jgi:hypothetical protein
MLKRWRRKAEQSALARAIPWLEFDAAEAERHRSLVDDIMGQKVAGVTVTGVFTPDETARAVEVMEANRAQETPVVFGTVLGRPLMQSGMSRDRTQHLDEAQHFRPIFADMFGVDPHERLADLLRTLSSGLELTAPAEDGRMYNPGQIRIMEPGGGGLPAHAGNEFLVSNKDGSASHLWETTDALDHMSYFVMLQRAEEGGELSVFDKLWLDSRETEAGAVPLTHDADEFDELPHLTINPEPGALVLFWAGRRWHRVEEVHGTLPRLTYGGFIAPSQDHRELHCWS